MLCSPSTSEAVWTDIRKYRSRDSQIIFSVIHGWLAFGGPRLPRVACRPCQYSVNQLSRDRPGRAPRAPYALVLGEPGAESLLGKGDLLYDLGRGPVRAQSYFIPQADFVRALAGQSVATK